VTNFAAGEMSQATASAIGGETAADRRADAARASGDDDEA
jgi:hypothetical protein